MKEKPISKVTVTDICKIADINRSTFYSYYEDVYALLTQIQNEMFEDIVFTLGKDNWFDDLLKLVDKNRDLCAILIVPNGDSSFIRQLIYLGYDSSMRIWHDMFPDATSTQLDYYYAYLASGVIGILENWIANEYRDTIEEVGDLIMKFSTRGLSSLGESPEKPA